MTGSLHVQVAVMKAYGGLEISSIQSLSNYEMKVRGSLHIQVAFPPGKYHLVFCIEPESVRETIWTLCRQETSLIRAGH